MMPSRRAVDPQIGPSPYLHGVKCYVGWQSTIKRWKITGHRWGEIPYHVGEYRDWAVAVEVAQAHVRGEGLAWKASFVRK